jgi:uncharacterized protein
MSQASPVYVDYDFWVPAFEVRLGGSPVSPEVIRDVLSVSYSDTLDKLDSCQITLTNWDEEAKDFKYVGRTAGRPPIDFKPGLELELWMGYQDRGGLTLMMTGEVIAVTVDFPAGGQPSVQLRALNKLYKLYFKQETQVYEDQTDSQIAEAVLAKMEQDLSSRPSATSPVRLRLETSDANASIEQPHEYVVTNAEYPIVFLMERARHNGYDIYVEEDDEAGVTKLHFHPPDRGIPPAYELVWGGSLINFKPTIKTKEQVSKVTVRGWDQVAKQAIEGSATWDDLTNRGLMDLAEMTAADSALAGSEVVITDEPVFNEQEAKQKAIDHLTSVANDLVSGAGSTVGLPSLRAGRPVHIRKLGPPFNGRYLVTSSTHAIADGGYTTQFEARMEQPDQEGA